MSERVNTSDPDLKRRLLLGGMLALPFSFACTPIVPGSRSKRIAHLEASVIHNNIKGIDQEKLNLANRIRNDLYAALTEFIPQYFLDKGLWTSDDGDEYWAGQVDYTKKIQTPFKGHTEYPFSLSVLANKDSQTSQTYSSFVTYDDNWNLEEYSVDTESRIGPHYINPKMLSRPVPGYTDIIIPADSLKDVALQMFDLPSNLNWNQATFNAPFYGGLPIRDWVELTAKGKTVNGSNLEFSIEEQGTASLSVGKYISST